MTLIIHLTQQIQFVGEGFVVLPQMADRLPSLPHPPFQSDQLDAAGAVVIGENGDVALLER